MKRSLLSSALVAALSLSASGPAAADALADLRAEFNQALEQLKQTYEARIQSLEERLDAADNKATEAQAKAEGAQSSAEQAQAAALAATPPAAPNSFNPEIALILDGRYANLKDIPDRHITGFLPLGPEPEGLSRGFSTDATELSIGADIDPYFRGFANIVYEDGGADVEEAYVQTLSLGHGFTIKGGRFRSAIGYMNTQHPHMWDFVDNPLMYQALYGEGYIQDGLAAKWVAPTDLLVEITGDVGRGANFPGTDRDVNGVNAYSLAFHLGGDVGDSSSWRTGVSYLHTRADGREFFGMDPGAMDVTGDFGGRSRTWMADFVWKWAPHGNIRDTNFKFQAEYFRRKESGTLTCMDANEDGTDDSACLDALGTGPTSGAYDSDQSGWYVQGVYQFMPYWRVGYRYDRLDRGNANFMGGDVGAFIASLADYNPSKHTLMLDFAPSEFSLLRLQYVRDKSMLGLNENQVFLQYVYSLGTHGAHQF
jgi:hypothetical protein